MSLPLLAGGARTAIADGAPSPISDKTLTSLAQTPASALAASTLHLANALQSTLELDPLIALFAAEVNRVVPHDGLEYLNADETLRFVHGRDARHSYSYDLVVRDRSLGFVTFRSDQHLTERQTAQLEALICALVYPLRNALMYKRALDTALKDPVTGLNNRAALNATMEREVNLAHRHGSPLSIIMLDLDHFKRINDTYGHPVGDSVLRALGKRTSDCTRGSDMVFRYGGEEFTVVLSNTDLNGAGLLAERIRKAIGNLPIAHGDLDIPVTVSVGVSSLEHGDTAASLVQRADAALYEAKSGGRNQVRIQVGAGE